MNQRQTPQTVPIGLSTSHKLQATRCRYRLDPLVDPSFDVGEHVGMLGFVVHLVM